MTIQVAPDDCTGCGVCVDVCPATSKEVVRHKAINMEPKHDHLGRERAGWEFFLDIPEFDRARVKVEKSTHYGHADSIVTVTVRCVADESPERTLAKTGLERLRHVVHAAQGTTTHAPRAGRTH